MTRVAMVAIVPPDVVNVDGVRMQLLNLFRKKGRKLRREYEKTTATWKNKPTFDMQIALRRNEPIGGVVVATDDEIYRYLDWGTRIRWALMSQDWKSKTQPRKIASGPGRGRAVIRGRRAMQARGIGPRPGIQAREFSTTITENEGKDWPKEVQAAINRGL